MKLYVRDSVTWLSWPWQARALWPLLMRKLDGAGVLECGNTAPAKAISLVVMLPLDVVEVGLAAILESGTLERVEWGVLAPKFLEGQEARKSDALRQKEARERRRQNIVSRKPTDSGETASHGVTRRHETSQPVTLQPSPAQPSPETTASAKKPADPRLRPLQERLEQIYGLERQGGRYKHGGPKDTLALKALLPVASDEEICRRWAVGLKATGWASCSTFAQLGSKWNDLAAPVATRGALATGNADWTNRPKSFEEELADGL